MRTSRRRAGRETLLSSLATRLTLAVVALLLLSLGLTTAVVVAQAQRVDRAAARDAAARVLAGDTREVRTSVCRSLFNVNAPTDRPLAFVGALPDNMRVLLTSWDRNRVIGDTGVGAGAGTPSAAFHFPVDYHGALRRQGVATIGGTPYAYLALQVLPSCGPNVASPVYRNIVALTRVMGGPDRARDAVRQLALPGAVAILISSLVALLVLRAITRPLHDMTLASERMAAGDYDQRVSGAGAAGEIGQLARAFNRMSLEVRRARELQRQFVANVSHDLRSPLTSIIGFSQMLAEDEEVAARSRRAATIINGEAQRLHRLTMDLLELSRLESGRLALSRRPLDLNALLRDVVAPYDALPIGRDLTVVERLHAGALPVVGDPDRLTQVVGNLLDNALKFCNPGGEVRLSSAREGDVAVVEVYNTGSGIAPEQLPLIFDRFYRGDHSRAEQTGGSGIGLAIVRELVHAHGGDIAASSEQGAWTAMTLRLPLASDFTKDLHAANTAATGDGV